MQFVTVTKRFVQYSNLQPVLTIPLFLSLRIKIYNRILRTEHKFYSRLVHGTSSYNFYNLNILYNSHMTFIVLKYSYKYELTYC
jgi:hypothetical protein